MSVKTEAMNALVAFANAVFKDCDVMRKAELIEPFAAALKAASLVAGEPAVNAAVSPVEKPVPAITSAMCALAERSVLMRDDQLNQLMYSLMLKFNVEDIKEWLDAAVQRSAVGSATSGVP